MANKLTLKFELEQPPHITKNAVRYVEVGDPESFKVGAFYVKKAALGAQPYPKEISVALTW